MSAAWPDQSQTSAASPAGRRLGLSLLVIATAQLMLVLDDSIANIALPSIQADLGVSAANLPWVINAYVLVFGALLLFGGRVGDLFGRRRVLRIGIAVFVAASLLGGLAPNTGLLIAARALQGLGAALAAPNALALIATTFPIGKPRNSAMAVYGAMSAVGIVAGVLLGGALTGLLDWRWVFFINIPIGLAVLAGTGALPEGGRGRGRLDTPGAVSGTGAMVALVYGLTRAGEHGWTDPLTLAAFAVAAVLLAVTGSGLMAMGGSVASVLVAARLVKRRVTKRTKAFSAQLPDALSLIASSLSAGHTFLRAVQMMCEESAPPMSEEFGRLVAETRLGDNVTEALERMAQRLDIRDLDMVVQAIRIQQTVGGKLADLFHTLSDVIRARDEVKREVQILTAEGRMSAYVLAGLVPLLFGVIRVTNPKYIEPLYTGTGLIMLIGCAVSVVAGLVVILRMVKIEV